MPTPTLDRRGWLRTVIGVLAAAITSIVGVVIGGAIVSPSSAARREQWLPAARLSDLDPGVPSPVAIRVTRQDGYAEAVEQQAILLVKSASGDVHALSSTCTHLGCRVSYDPGQKLIKCPCHGGVYGLDGGNLSGPPLRPLARLASRVEDGRVYVQL
jgi:quinol---cytochrome c reductase iron-sulfur subunit, bacillus type